MVRNIDESRVMNTDVVCLGGARVNDITKELKQINYCQTSKYDRVILLCGGNDCSVQGASAEFIASDYKGLIKAAKTTGVKHTTPARGRTDAR